MNSLLRRLTTLIVFPILTVLQIYANIDSDIFLMGNINGWKAHEKYKFQLTDNPDIVYLSLTTLSGEFKIADATWQKYNFGGALFTTDNKVNVEFGKYDCVKIGDNFTSKSLSNVTLIFDARISYAPVLEVIPTSEFNIEQYKAKPDSPYYLRGTLHGYNWSPEAMLHFSNTEQEGVYTLCVKELYGEFKISDVSWKDNYGARSINVGEWCSLTPNGANINSPHLINANITLDLRHAGKPKLLVTGEPFKGDTEASGIYLMSKMMDSMWKASPQYEFRHKPGSDIHTLSVSTLYDGFKFADPSFSNINLGNTGMNGWRQIDGIGTYDLKRGGDAFGCPPLTDLIITLDLTDRQNPKFTIAKDPNASTEWKDNFSLKYAEEFNGTSLNYDRWLPYNGPADWEGSLSVFTDREENISVNDGSLSLITRREKFNGMEITSGGVRSFRRWVFRYGRLDIRMMQPPTNNGLCVGLWLVGYHYSWPSSGEIDILEQGHGDDIEQGNTPYSFVAGTPCGPYAESMAYTYGRNVIAPYPIQDGEYHLYTMFWDKNRMLFFLDYDKYPDAEPFYAQIIRQDNPEDPYYGGNYFHHPYFVILHIAAQQTVPQTYVITAEDVTALNDANNHTAEMKVDYVRLYQQDNPEDILEYIVPGDDYSYDSNIIEMPSTDDDEETKYFNVMGQPVTPNTTGIIIKKKGMVSTKILNK